MLAFGEITTEQVQAKHALAESEARFRATFENAAVGIAHVAPDGKWLRVNRALCRILGYTADELLARSFQDITHPDDLAADLAEVKGMLDGKIDSYGMDKRYRRKDGSIVWARLTVGGVRKTDGSIDYLVSVVEDISARKQAEQALQASKDRLQLALDATRLGSFQYDRSRRLISCDERYQEILGLAKDELQVEELMKVIHPDDADMVRAYINTPLQALEKPEAREHRILVRGEIRWIKVHRLAYFEDAGHGLHAEHDVGTVQDVTERKEREEKEHLLMREINHRAKNMLSVVHSIAQQSAAQIPKISLRASPIASKHFQQIRICSSGTNGMGSRSRTWSAPSSRTTRTSLVLVSPCRVPGCV